MSLELCPLCDTVSDVFFQKNKQLYYLCQKCKGIFLSKDLLPSKELERLRYQKHNNDINNIGYFKFISPIINAVLKDFTAKHTGLDFGAGPEPVISKFLTNKNYNIKWYDPFFFNSPQLLQKKYDYIVCCEVIEHFHKPKTNFELLKSMLNENGKLYCKTSIFNHNINFNKWYYKNDFTHVFFYQEKTLKTIQKDFGFSDVIIQDDLITFLN